MKPGDDVWVRFEGLDHRGEVLKPEQHGYIMCLIEIDPFWDYGSQGSRLSPYQTVMVRSAKVRPRLNEGD